VNVGEPPPFVGDAVNVTLVPEQILFPGFALMITLGTTFGLTVIIKLFDVAGLPATHEAFDVITQVITFPLVKLFVV
jgi:hypothetical protein